MPFSVRWRSRGVQLVALIVFGSTVLLAGCDNTIEPFDEETGLYSIYGYLSLSEESNVIRVRHLNEPLDSDAARELDAEVRLENVEDGTTERLESSLQEFDGVYVHNFEVTMPVEPETQYQLTVERSDGATATSAATTPNIGEVDYGPEGEDCDTPIRITFHDIENPLLVLVSPGFYWQENKYATQWYPERGEGNTAILEFTPEDVIWAEFCDDLLGCPPPPDHPTCADFDDEHLHIHYYHFGPEWLEHNLPVDPLESFDVEDGLGFFGGLREGTFSIRVDAASSEE